MSKDAIMHQATAQNSAFEHGMVLGSFCVSGFVAHVVALTTTMLAHSNSNSWDALCSPVHASFMLLVSLPGSCAAVAALSLSCCTSASKRSAAQAVQWQSLQLLLCGMQFCIPQTINGSNGSQRAQTYDTLPPHSLPQHPTGPAAVVQAEAAAVH